LSKIKMINLGNMEIIRNRWRLFLIPLLVIFSTIILIFIVLIPRFKKVIEFKELIKEKNLRLEKLSSKLADLEGLDEVSLKNKADLTLKAIPDKKDVMVILSLLTNISQVSQINLDSLKVSPGEISSESAAQKSNSMEIINFEIKAIGDRIKILDFLKKIEGVIPLLNIGKVKIGKYEQNFSVQVSVENYYSGLPKSLGKIDSPLPKLTKEEENASSLLDGFEFYERLRESPIPSPPTSSEGRSSPF